LNLSFLLASSLPPSSLVFMLTHIVIWKYREEVSQAEREEHVRQLRQLPTLIPEIESFEVGFDVLRLPRSYDTGLVAVFRDRAALEIYSDHPEHVKAARYGRSLSEQVASVDFED
jgi:Stress responsive A/B Barrel Domain